MHKTKVCETCGAYRGEAALVVADYNGWDVFFGRNSGFYAVSLDGERREIGTGTALDKFFQGFARYPGE